MTDEQASRLILISIFTQLLLIGAGASAQDAPARPQPGTTSQTDAQATTSTGGIQDIIVTANRRSQNLQKVSAAVQVVTGDKIRTQGLSNVEQILSDVPSVQITAQPAGFNVDIRGQAADRPASSAQGSVAVEFDGVYNIQSYATTVGFFDTSRIEVLPGPQSTRYGPNAKGGVVNIISNDPVLGSWAGQGSITGGSYGLVRGEIAQNIPIGDTLAIRVSGAGIHRDSYFDPATGNAIAESGRIKVLYQPDDRLTAKLEYEFDHIGGTGSGAEAGGPPFLAAQVATYNGDSINNYANPWDHGDYSSGCGTFPPDFNAFHAKNSGTCQPYQTSADIHQNMAIGNLSYRFGDWGVLDLTQSYINEGGTQYDCKPESETDIGTTHNCYDEFPLDPFYSYSTELRLHNAAGSKLLWNVGFYHWNYLVENWTNQFGGSANAKSLAATATNAGFADVTYPITDRLRLIGGVRLSGDTRSLRENNDPTLTIYNTSYPVHFDYRVGEEFDITPISMQYFTVSTGYAPGSVGEGVRSDGSTGFYVDPNETLTAFELGSKNRFLNNTLQLNGDAFYYIQSNYAFNNMYSNFTANPGTAAAYYCPYVSYSSPPAALNCQSPNTTANAHTFGLEAQIRYNLTPADVFGVNMTYLHARFDTKQSTCNTLGLPAADLGSGRCYIGTNNPTLNAPPPDFTLINGQVEDHSPSFQGTFSYTHTFRFASGATLAAGGEAVRSSGYLLIDSYDSAIFYQPGYWQGNVNVGYTPAEGRWSLNGFVRNVGDYAVKVSAVPATTIGDPLTFGGTLSLKW